MAETDLAGHIGVESGGNIVNAIERHALANPQRPAIIEGGRVLTYSGLQTSISQHAGYLAELGVGRSDRIGLVLQDNADHLTLMLAAASLGAATLSLNWRAKVDEKRQIAHDFGIKLLINDASVRTPEGISAIGIDDAWRRSVEQAKPHAPLALAGPLPFRILLTSGTMGLPKGVEMTHARMMAWRQSVKHALNLTSEERHLSVLPLAFTGSFLLNLPHLLLGNTVELFPPLFAPEEFVDAVKKRGITGSTIVPTILRRLLALAKASEPLLPELRYLVCLGSPITAGERRDAVRLLTRGFYDNYGASGSGPITFCGAEDIERQPDSVGRVVPLMEVQVVDQRRQLCSAGEIGLLRCRGPTVAAGFCSTGGAAVGETFEDGWYYPGETAKMDENGFIYLIGRASEVILCGGSNIYPLEIEQMLMRHPTVVEAAIIGIPSHEYGEEVMAFVQVSGVTPKRDLMEICRRGLAAYKVPRDIIFVDELPKSAAGKVVKSELLRLFQAQRPGRGAD